MNKSGIVVSLFLKEFILRSSPCCYIISNFIKLISVKVRVYIPFPESPGKLIAQELSMHEVLPPTARNH